jgi:hypothetical protein
MAIVNPAPVVVNGVSYPFLSFSLSISTYSTPEGMKVNLFAELRPYRDTEQGPEILRLPAELEASLGIPVRFLFPDAQGAAMGGDLKVARVLSGFEKAAQEYVNAVAGAE